MKEDGGANAGAFGAGPAYSFGARTSPVPGASLWWGPGAGSDASPGPGAYAGASSARLYWESFSNPPMVDVEVPVGVSVFPHEIFKASRRWCEARYKQLAYHNVLDKGGHFAAFEQPEIFANEVRAAFRAIQSF